jgi:hypothetical protein
MPLLTKYKGRKVTPCSLQASQIASTQAAQGDLQGLKRYQGHTVMEKLYKEHPQPPGATAEQMQSGARPSSWHACPMSTCDGAFHAYVARVHRSHSGPLLSQRWQHHTTQ